MSIIKEVIRPINNKSLLDKYYFVLVFGFADRRC